MGNNPSSASNASYEADELPRLMPTNPTNTAQINRGTPNAAGPSPATANNQTSNNNDDDIPDVTSFGTPETTPTNTTTSCRTNSTAQTALFQSAATNNAPVATKSTPSNRARFNDILSAFPDKANAIEDKARDFGFICSISDDFMDEPTSVQGSYVYERAAIVSWLNKKGEKAVIPNNPNISFTKGDLQPSHHTNSSINSFLERYEKKAEAAKKPTIYITHSLNLAHTTLATLTAQSIKNLLNDNNNSLNSLYEYFTDYENCKSKYDVLTTNLPTLPGSKGGLFKPSPKRFILECILESDNKLIIQKATHPGSGREIQITPPIHYSHNDLKLFTIEKEKAQNNNTPGI